MAGSRPGALAGLRVVDLSRALAGPLCAQMLADHGADVIKVEPPGGDETRTLGPPFWPWGDAAYFGVANRGKRAIGLDLSRPEGREVALRLLDGADVLIENFLPGTMERWELGYEATLAPRFPRLVYCGISGFGADGPLGGLPGYDAVVQAIGGLMSVNGTPESGPTRLGLPLVDLATGLHAGLGVLLALNERHRSGRGQRVEATLFDTALALLVPHAANWFCSQRPPAPSGNPHPNIAPYDTFRAGGREVFVGVVNDGQFARLCEHIGRPRLAEDPRFESNAARVAHRDALRREIESAIEGADPDALCAGLMRAGIPAGPVNSVPQALEHPHTAHRAMVVPAEPGAPPTLGVPIKLSRSPGDPGGTPPGFGRDADAVLAEAGYSAAEVDRLRAAGIVVDRRRGRARPA